MEKKDIIGWSVISITILVFLLVIAAMDVIKSKQLTEDVVVCYQSIPRMTQVCNEIAGLITGGYAGFYNHCDRIDGDGRPVFVCHVKLYDGESYTMRSDYEALVRIRDELMRHKTILKGCQK